MTIGIYKITNILNKKIYIGSSVNVEKRWNSHKKCLRSNNHHSKKLQNSWNKYGEDSFSFEIIEILENQFNIIEREQYYIDYYKNHKLFNICLVAYSRLGYKHSENTKEKIRLANCGKTMSELSRIKMSVSAIKKFQKNKMSIETRTRMSNSRKNKTPWNKGVKTSEEVRQKISNSLLGRTSPMKDKTHSYRTKEQMSISRLGEKNGNSTITAEIAIKIVELSNKQGLSQRKIARMLNISRGCVCAVLKGRTWQHITKIKNMEK